MEFITGLRRFLGFREYPKNTLSVEHIKLNASDATFNKRSSKLDILKHINLMNSIRWEKDMLHLRMAIDNAKDVERPNRLELHHLYESVSLDTHTSAVMQARLMRILSNEWTFQNADGEDLPEVRQAFEKQWFFESIERIIESIFFGYSLLELQYDPTINNISRTTVVPRTNVIPEKDIVVRESYDEQGLEWRKANEYWIFSAGHNEDLGLLHKAAQFILIKKIATGAWAQYAEIFGMPMRVGKVASASQQDRDQMADDLREMGSAAFAVIGITDEIEFKENQKGDAFQVYNQLIERANSEISKLILGQTMTTDNGSSRSQSEVHERVAEAFAAADRRFVQFTINDNLIPLLKRIGMVIPDDAKFVFKQHQEVKPIDIDVLRLLIENCQFSETAIQQIAQKTGYDIIGFKKTITPTQTPDPQPEPPKKPTARRP